MTGRRSTQRGKESRSAARLVSLRLSADYLALSYWTLRDMASLPALELDKRKVVMDEAIRRLGDHEVKIKLHPDVVAVLKVLVSKEG